MTGMMRSTRRRMDTVRYETCKVSRLQDAVDHHDERIRLRDRTRTLVGWDPTVPVVVVLLQSNSHDLAVETEAMPIRQDRLQRTSERIPGSLR